MAPDELGPEELTIDGLPAARRGLDRKAVSRLLQEAAARWSRLQAEHDELLAHIEERGGIENLTRDLREIGEHVGRMLGEAQEAAENLRSRARQEAQERHLSAEGEAAAIAEQAERDAFKMRGDAWRAGSDLLEQVRRTAEAMTEQAEADVLITRAEAEQDAHRFLAEARRQAADITRAARSEGERAVAEARHRAEEIIAEAADRAERTGREVPEQRPEPASPGDRPRDALWGVKVIEADEQLEPTLRPAGDPHHPGYGDALAAEVERLRADESGEPHPPWYEGGEEPSVREPVLAEPLDVADLMAAPEEPDVEPVEAGGPPEPAAAGAEEPEGEAEEASVVEEAVAELVVVEEAEEAGEPEEPAEVEEAGEPEEPEEPVAGVGEASPADAGGLLAELFGRLRSGQAVDTEPAPPVPVVERAEPAPPPEPVGVPEAITERDRLLLPIINDASREVRRQLVEVQNEVLDTIRVTKRKPWAPEGEPLHEALAAMVEPAVHAAAGAAASAVARSVGGTPSAVIEIRSARLIGAMADRLLADLEDAARRGAPGGRVSEEAARVFRGWRNDAAQRWVRMIALAAYHDSFLAGLAASGVATVAGVRHGHLCGECPAASGVTWDPAGGPPEGNAVPPAHLDCTCSVAAVT